VDAHAAVKRRAGWRQVSAEIMPLPAPISPPTVADRAADSASGRVER
jgi:hypothetical protein